ncbi:hypothetical protein FRC00_012639 [Tulasnella sp. 408]|nr:hypothetical protein FRC00_012639 [Tulasnella sp. 408]
MSDIGDLSNDLALLSQSDVASNPTCSSSTKGCTCLNMDGSHKSSGEMCGLENCPCCTSRNYNQLAINALFGPNGTNATSGFAVSTERDTANMGPVAGSANGNSSPVASSLGMGYAQALQIPISTNRSRSSSQSSFSSLTNGMGGMEISSMGGAGGATALGRANSTGQIGRNSSKFKSIAPKPIHHNTDPVLGRSGATQLAQNGSVGLAGSQQPFSFPRASPGGPPPPPPALTLTQPQPTDGTTLEQLFQGTLNSSSNPGQSLFGNNQTFNPKPLFDFGSTSATASDIRHSRNFSHPTNLQTVGTSLSGPPSPHTRSPIHFGDASGTGSGPASPLLHNASSIPNSPLMTQPSSPSMHQSTPIITFSHGRSQSSSNAGLLEPRPVHYSHPSGHARSASASLLDPRSSGFPSVIVTPASPHPGSSGQQH